MAKQDYGRGSLKKHLESKKLDPQAIDMLTHMLSLDPNKRLTAEAAYMVQHCSQIVHSKSFGTLSGVGEMTLFFVIVGTTSVVYRPSPLHKTQKGHTLEKKDWVCFWQPQSLKVFLISHASPTKTGYSNMCCRFWVSRSWLDCLEPCSTPTSRLTHWQPNLKSFPKCQLLMRRSWRKSGRRARCKAWLGVSGLTRKWRSKNTRTQNNSPGLPCTLSQSNQGTLHAHSLMLNLLEGSCCCCGHGAPFGPPEACSWPFELAVIIAYNLSCSWMWGVSQGPNGWPYAAAALQAACPPTQSSTCSPAPSPTDARKRCKLHESPW